MHTPLIMGLSGAPSIGPCEFWTGHYWFVSSLASHFSPLLLLCCVLPSLYIYVTSCCFLWKQQTWQVRISWTLCIYGASESSLPQQNRCLKQICVCVCGRVCVYLLEFSTPPPPSLWTVTHFVLFVSWSLCSRKRKESEPRTKCLLNNADITPHHPTDPVEMRRINFQTPGEGNRHTPSQHADIESGHSAQFTSLRVKAVKVDLTSFFFFLHASIDLKVHPRTAWHQITLYDFIHVVNMKGSLRIYGQWVTVNVVVMTVNHSDGFASTTSRRLRHRKLSTRCRGWIHNLIKNLIYHDY